MKHEEFTFTHYWVSGFGWENTVFCPQDFETVEILGYNFEENYHTFLATNSAGGKHILKGKYEHP